MSSPITEKLLRWYRAERRDLPWRGQRDAYAVWVSEIMLQQTRVETVIPYYRRWMQRFPTVETLAAASQREVLSLWEGLGYYGRARNLHRAARVVVDEYDGELPMDVKALQALPGIGRYTAGAIASLAYGLDEPAVDGNAKRVLARLFDVDEAVDTAGGERRIWDLAAEHLPSGHAGDFNQALMELGATVCTARSPRCSDCLLREDCQAYTLGVQKERPVKKPKGEIPHHTFAAAVIWRDGRVLIARRPQGGLLGGMWEFPGGRRERGEEMAACLRREIEGALGVKVHVGEQIGEYHHAYTHFRETRHAFKCSLKDGAPKSVVGEGLRWVPPSELGKYPMGKIDRDIAEQVQRNQR